MTKGATKVLFPLIVVLCLVALAWFGAGLPGVGGRLVFGAVVPYLAFGIFVVGFIYRVVCWGTSAVPFVITSTAGQQKTLPWIKPSKIDNPSSTVGAVGRMALEVLLFRSLFKNSKTEKRGGELGVGSAKWLWLGSLVFHWSMLLILLRHLRLFLDPVPGVIMGLDAVDTFLHIGVPLLYITDALILTALTFLFIRRVAVPYVRYISLPADYLALFLLLAVAISGVVMRYFFKVDILTVKEMLMGLATLHPVLTGEVAPIFCTHLFMVSMLFAYFPWSKLMHAGGVFLVPTRNLPNNSRVRRHVNPWNYEVDVHTYDEYEDEFREKMIRVGLPVEHDLPAKTDEPTEQGE